MNFRSTDMRKKSVAKVRDGANVQGVRKNVDAADSSSDRGRFPVGKAGPG